jgi:uncharacterized protein
LIPNDRSVGWRLEFEWDSEKATSNAAKHGITFAQAATVFSDALALSVYDHEHSEREDRWFTLGMWQDGNLIAVSHTYVPIAMAGAQIRIISARKATRTERIQYERESDI